MKLNSTDHPAGTRVLVTWYPNETPPPLREVTVIKWYSNGFVLIEHDNEERTLWRSCKPEVVEVLSIPEAAQRAHAIAAQAEAERNEDRRAEAAEAEIERLRTRVEEIEALEARRRELHEQLIGEVSRNYDALEAANADLRRQLDAAKRDGEESPGVKAIAEERSRQVGVEGWTIDHDDQHREGQMAYAASCYAITAARQLCWGEELRPLKPEHWPWDDEWWKPKDIRRNLVRAGALIAAELDRLYRESAASLAAKGASDV